MEALVGRIGLKEYLVGLNFATNGLP